VLALRWHGREDVRLDDVPEPCLRGALDTLVAVALCGICGTDVAETKAGPLMIRTTPHPLTGQAPPVTLGHELVGRVVAQRDEPFRALAHGQRVTADACLRCGRCAACLRGDYHQCRLGGSIGLHVDGGFAPLVALPSYLLIPVPDGVEDAAAAQTEPFAVALHGLERAGLSPGDDVVVFGFGPIGAASALLARALGARPHVIEIDDTRRTTAEQLGLRTLDPGEDLVKHVRKTIGDGGAQVAVESTGVASVAPTAVECTMRGGRVALLGLPKEPVNLDLRRLTLFERSLVGSLGYRHDLPRVLALMEDGSIDPLGLLGPMVTLAEAADELLRQTRRTPASIKTLVAVSSAAPLLNMRGGMRCGLS
jgi:(R,R)-butanediol dehydrogenase/meso-butanediol dehydrogenase/diacetyl reductase